MTRDPRIDDYIAGRVTGTNAPNGLPIKRTENLDTVGQAGRYASRGYARLGRRVAFIGHDGAQVRTFLDAVRNGAQMKAGTGEEAPTASLAGLSAALLLIDETQGRLGTKTALLRRGPLREQSGAGERVVRPSLSKRT